MSHDKLKPLVGAVILSGTLAIAGIEAGQPVLTAVFKPLATTLLLFIVGWPTHQYAWFVVAGILLSLVGDVALLGDGALQFKIGLGAFLLAHVAYIVGSARIGVFSRRVLVVAIIAIAATVLLLTKLWAGAANMRVPILLYGAALTGMVVGSWSTLGSSLVWARFAAGGSVLFYVSDASLALNRFHAPIPHEAFLSLGVYWLGQIGISLAARGGLGERATA